MEGETMSRAHQELATLAGVRVHTRCGGPARGGPKPPHPSSEREGALAVERGGEGGHQPLDTQPLGLQAPEALRGLAVLRGRHPGKRGLHSDIRGSI